MKRIAFQQVCRDYLALRCESPDLLPILEDEGESARSAVLTLERELAVKLPLMAVEATLATPPVWLEVKSLVRMVQRPEEGGYVAIRLPADYLKFHSLAMADWKEAVREIEPEGSLRRLLGRNAPAGMICRERPMVTEERDADGMLLKAYGTTGGEAEVCYVPAPTFDGEWLEIDPAAYFQMLKG